MKLVKLLIKDGKKKGVTMAKYKRNGIEYDAEKFNSAQPPSSWPIGVVVNNESVTGYSIDDREIADGSYVVYKSTGTRFPITEEGLNKKYVPE